ncbi:MAG: hypothetical protein ACTHL3_06880 [Candidatus Nitrosocosmicus sp.]
MPTKLSTTVNKIRLLPKEENVTLVFKFHEFMKENGASERHQNNNLKAILAFSNHFEHVFLKDINLHNGAAIKPEALHTMMNQLKKRILRLIETGEIKGEEREKMLYVVNNKKFNPYCIRHSAITSDSDYLPEYALKKKVRWSMNSRQGSSYIKTRMGNELKNKILAYNGIIPEDEIIKKPSILACPRCELVNVIENKYCSKFYNR